LKTVVWILTTVMILASPLAGAIDGTEVQKGAPRPVCRILFRNPEGQLQGICSGTLTGKNEVTTAAHCIEGKPESSMTVQCGFHFLNLAEQNIEKTQAGNEVDTQGPRFLETHQVQEATEHPQFDYPYGVDTATLKLQTESRLPIVPIAKPQEIKKEYFESNGRMRPEIRCEIAGFGLKDWKAGAGYEALLRRTVVFRQNQTGEYQIQLANIRVTPAEEKIIDTDLVKSRILIKEIPFRKRIRMSVISGDSGGPLLCQSKNGWRLVGVILGARIVRLAGKPGWATFSNVFWNPYESYRKLELPEPPKISEKVDRPLKLP
jgi:hypothetical protein